MKTLLVATTALTVLLAPGAQAATATLTGGIDTPAAAASASSDYRKILVTDQSEYNTAAKNARPGDIIVLSNGTWKDFDIVLEAKGTESKKIALVAETPGQVILTGQSSLRLGGEYLVVSGLVFRDGYTPNSEVISFRRDSETLAFNSRVTNTVIENYSNPDRTQRDMWVVMYGQNNEFDHNHLSGKLNAGPTMAVRLNTEDSQENGHFIHHNYFGPRPVLGSNGGETLRIGTSHYSLTTSGSRVENNYFDRCSGEVEIISNKSGGNIYRGNTFFESRGTLTLRHGNGTLVENNLFDGNGAPYTGGVRVINAQQTIRNNYFTGLTGTGFSGALVVMNGVPNSPINRYHQVDGAVIENNTFDHVANIELAEGSDEERSAVPVNSVFRHNLLVTDGVDPFDIHDDISGIAFSANVTDTPLSEALAAGFSVTPVYATTAKLAPRNGAGASQPFGVARDDTGVDWYPKPADGSPFHGGKEISVAPGNNTISAVLAEAAPGDTIVLQPGAYHESRIINLQVPLTFRSADPAATKPVISFERGNLFHLSGNGALRLDGLQFVGTSAPDAVGNSLIRSVSTGGTGNHLLEINSSEFSDFTVHRDFSVVSAEKGTFFDRIDVRESTFTNLSGPVFDLDSEKDDYGLYNAEYLDIADSTFENIGGSVASVYRGGRDESTFGPHVIVTGSTFSEVGTSGAPLLALHGVQYVRLEENSASDSNPASLVITTGNPARILSGNSLPGSDAFLDVTTFGDPQ